ncbi:MAG TPA: polysaccharide deacetylase family protein, partial [Gaiellales bacterium]|nr:polysaccharide deacetylase family protein [Gaiellales bacterium]
AAPTLRLVDAADTPGKLDLRSVRLSQSGGSLALTFRVNGSFAVSELSGTADRIVCVDIVPRGHPAGGERVCLIGGSGRHALYRLPLATGGPKPKFVAAHVQHIRRGAKVTFNYANIGLRAERIDWSATSTWKGRAACRNVCHDSVPNRGRAAWAIDSFTLDGCTAAGPSQRFGGPAGGKMVALTFDDGPSIYTPQVLSILNRYGAHATFFEIGRQVGPLAATSRAVIHDGDVVGNHTWSHPDLTVQNTAAQVRPTQAAIYSATGFRPCLLRPPYGIAPAGVVGIVRSLGLLTIQWDVDPADWSRPGASVIAQRVLSAVRPGSIVIMHDGGGDRSETVQALGTIVPTLLGRGYHLVTVPQLLGLRPAYRYQR